MEQSEIDLEKMENIVENIKVIRENISNAALQSGRNENDVRFMAVTKTVDPVYINKAIDCGIDLIGENKVQEFLSKENDLHLERVEKHLIGHLQSNKVRKILGHVDMIQSVDSVEIASQIQRIATEMNIDVNALIELNIGDETSKTGLDKSKFLETVDQISTFDRIKIKGLMTIPPICDSKKELYDYFDEMYKLFVDIGNKKTDNISMDILSMGMSGDYVDAIKCGSNHVRVGSAIFGKRIYK